jgi:hypothetical protein
LVRAWLEGNWDLVDGAFFDCWDENRHVLRTRDWLHRIPPYALKFRAYDHGYGKPFSVGWYAVSDGEWGLPEGALLKYREWYGSDGKPNSGLKLTVDLVAKGILARELFVDAEGRPQKEPIAYGVADPSIFIRDGGPSIMETQLVEGCAWRRADNKRIPGWAEMRRRLNGIEVRGEKVPMLYFLDCCDDSIRTIPTLQVDETNPEDLDTEGEDHAADETRYACMARPYTEYAPEVETDHFPKLPSQLTINELVEMSRQRRLALEYNEQ